MQEVDHCLLSEVWSWREARRVMCGNHWQSTRFFTSSFFFSYFWFIGKPIVWHFDVSRVETKHFGVKCRFQRVTLNIRWWTVVDIFWRFIKIFNEYYSEWQRDTHPLVCLDDLGGQCFSDCRISTDKYSAELRGEF